MTSPYAGTSTPQQAGAPAVSPWDAITPGQEQDALQSVSKMLTGSQMLKDQPGVVYALAAQKAHPADAGAIDQFMQGLDAEKQVRIAEASGAKIVLTPEQKTLLTGLNVDYSGVEYTQQNAIADTVAKVQATGQQVKLDAQGNPVLDAQGNVQVVQHQYKSKGIGRLFQTLHNDILKPVMRDAVSPALGGLNKAWNVVDQTAGNMISGEANVAKDFGVLGDLLPGAGTLQAVKQVWRAANGESTGNLAPHLANLGQDVQSEAGSSNQQLAAMKADGYDPGNFFSIMAYRAAGKEHGDLTPLETQWDQSNPSGMFGMNGQQAVDQARQFTENPKGYRQSVENDPTLTPAQAAAKLAAISSPQFMDLSRQVMAKRSSIGNSASLDLGIDPVKHPTEFALSSAGFDLAGAFLLDPTVVLGKLVKAAKISQVGIDSLADSEHAASLLDPARTGIFAKNVQRGWQQAIDLSGQIRDANAAGDTVAEAALTAKFNASLPGIAPLLPDFLGSNMITGYAEKLVDGKKIVEPTLGAGAGINSLADAAQYIASKDALLRLSNGRAATQASLMPGALSAFGIRKLKGAVAEWMTARSATRTQNAYATVVSAAKADPALADRLITEGDLLRMSPQADDAASAITGQTIATTAHDLENGGMTTADVPVLPSAARGELALTPQGKGNAAFNLRASGNPLGGAKVGWAGPTAIAARARLAAQRFTTLLPRNQLIDITDAQSGDKLYKMAMTYLNRGDARALQAAFNIGSGGQRKAIVSGLIDQLGHAAGLGKSASGQAALDLMKTKTEAYSSVGDEAVLDGQNLALHAGQVRTQWLLPSFRELHKNAAKVGLWDATMGRAMTSTMVDSLMVQWKMGALFKPSTVTRNQLEGWGRTAIEGQFGEALKARALLTMPNKELWAKGYGAATKAEYDSLIADGKMKEAEALARGSRLAGDLLGRSTVGTRIAEFAPFALAGRAYRKLYGSSMTEEDLKALETMGADDLGEALHGYGQQAFASEMGYKEVANESAEMTKNGVGPATIRRSIARAKSRSNTAGKGEVTSWTQRDTDGTLGADRFANALAQRVNPTPSVARAVLDVLEKPGEFDVQHVISALEDPAISKQMGLTGFGSLYWEDGSAAARRATTPNEIELGKREFANKVINDYRYLMTGQNGQYQKVLAKEIRQSGKAPDADWISGKLTNDNRPHGVLAPEVMAMPNGGIKSIPQMLQDIEGGAYQWMVERPLQRTTSSPVFWANYARARKGLNPVVEKLVNEQGISREAAENFAKELSIRNSWVKTEQLIDDPGQKSQFDIVARNMFPFSRATQAMVRRWGTGMWQDPARARKMMLAYEGSVQSGLVYTNTYGEPTFTYPGSGVMNMMMRELAKIPGFENFARFPLASNMTGGVLMSVPGADNPLRMSMGPMISVPMREIFKLFPDHRAMLDEIDSAINGPIGVGQTFSQFEPALARKLFTAMDDNQRSSALASSTIGAIANLAAGGQIPPADASPSQRDAFIQNLKTQVRSQLYLRAVLGLFAPAAPSAPSEGTAGSQADYAFSVTGIGQLSDEYKTLLDDVHGDTARANAIWSALHPDKVVYEYPHSQANASKAYLPSTAEALNWLESNAGFVGKYKDVAAYFLPIPAGTEPFNAQAYQTQIELGLRQRLTAGEFYTNVRVRDAESTYYPTVQQFDARITQAKANGDTSAVSTLTQEKSDWEAGFKNLNPLFAAKIDAYPDARAAATGQLADLHKMVQDGSVPDGLGGLLSQMLNAYDGYQSFIQLHKGSDAESTAMRSEAIKMFNTWAQNNVVGTPLQDLYQGVFRTLNTNFVSLAPATGG